MKAIHKYTYLLTKKDLSKVQRQYVSLVQPWFAFSFCTPDCNLWEALGNSRQDQDQDWLHENTQAHRQLFVCDKRVSTINATTVVYLVTRFNLTKDSLSTKWSTMRLAVDTKKISAAFFQWTSWMAIHVSCTVHETEGNKVYADLWSAEWVLVLVVVGALRWLAGWLGSSWLLNPLLLS